MTLWAYLSDNAGRLVFLAEQHTQLVLVSVAISTVVALAIAFGAQPVPQLRTAALAVAGTLLTIPSFALFALMIPLFGLGPTPTIIALATYGVFPILRNAVTGIDAVDPAIIDAARGLGMSSSRRLATVVFPLAWPIILNGIRTASIMLVATGAIGAVVQGPGLGKQIFTGLERIGGANALNQTLSGVIGVVAVALALDLLFALIAKATTLRGLR